MIEESPSAAISDTLRERMGRAAIKAAKAAHYVNAGTIEFLLESNEQFYFMEIDVYKRQLMYRQGIWIIMICHR